LVRGGTAFGELDTWDALADGCQIIVTSSQPETIGRLIRLLDHF
jgi:hypothetical protein